MRLLVPFLAELWAIRILAPSGQEICGEEGKKSREGYEKFVSIPDRVHEEKMASSLAKNLGSIAGGPGSDFAKLKYIGLGPKIWEVGGLEEVAGSTGGSDESYEEDGTNTPPKEKILYRRKITRIEEKDVQHVEIWKMDSMDIV